MKNIFTLATILIIGFQLNAQTKQGNWCATEAHQLMLEQEYPGYLQSFLQTQERINNAMDSVRQALQSGAESNGIDTIPIVFHILYNSSLQGNISDAQVIDAVRVINQDYNKQNTDTSNVRSIFKPYIANCKIHFTLAKIDPNGNCTTGITRNMTSLTDNATDAAKAVVDWDPDKYLNIWVVNSIANQGNEQGTYIAGYAQFPNGWGGGINSTYGVIVRNDQIGTIGTSSTDGRTLTHEIGHCLGLYHPFQGGCGSGSCSSSGDGVCDTPPAATAYYTCSATENSCSNDATQSGSPFSTDMPDQIENYMSYNSCTEMFSNGQNVRIHATISQVTGLQDLISSSNLVATGTNPGFSNLCSPVAAFKSDNGMICTGSSVDYTDESYGGQASSWHWTFPGGTPSSSSDSNVTVQYNTPGVYGATLTVSNSTGTDDTTMNQLVIVHSATAKYDSSIYQEGFENATEYGNDWIIENPDGNTKWQRTTIAASTGSASLYINNRINSTSGQIDDAISPSYNFSSITQPIMTFKVAYAQKSSSNNDELAIYYSADCGYTWHIGSVQSTNDIISAPMTTSNFIPSSSQWKEISIPIITSYQSKPNVLVKFQFTSGGGNNIYIDDINIGSSLGIENHDLESNSFKLYPNPAKDLVNIKFNLTQKTSNASLILTDMLGRTISHILNNATLQKGAHNIKLDLKALNISKGVYFIRLQTPKDGIITKKLIIE